MGMYIEKALKALIGQRVRIETRDGSIRHEPIVSVKFTEMKVEDETVLLPTTLFFDHREVDGVELNIITTIEVIPGAAG